MTMNGITERTEKRRTRTGPSPERWADTVDLVGRVLGVRLAAGNLDPDERLQLVGLIRAARSEGGGLRLAQLNARDLAKLVGLVEKGGGIAPGTFAERRRELETAAKFRELGRRTRQLRVTHREEDRLLLILAGHVAETRHLHLDHVSTLLTVLMQLEDGRAWAPKGRVVLVDGKPALVAHRDYGLTGADRDPEESLRSWRRSLDWLSEQQWLTVTRSGAESTIQLGPKTLRALGEVTS